MKASTAPIRTGRLVPLIVPPSATPIGRLAPSTAPLAASASTNRPSAATTIVHRPTTIPATRTAAIPNRGLTIRRSRATLHRARTLSRVAAIHPAVVPTLAVDILLRAAAEVIPRLEEEAVTPLPAIVLVAAVRPTVAAVAAPAMAAVAAPAMAVEVAPATEVEEVLRITVNRTIIRA